MPFPVSCDAETPPGSHHGTVTVETENQEPLEFWFQIEVGLPQSPPVSPARSPERAPREVGQSTRPAADADKWWDTGEPSWVPPAPPQQHTITELIERESLRSTAPRYHFFLGHRQVGGGAQVGEIDTILTHRLGLRCWRDLSQRVQDVNSMIRGVADSSVYILYLTSDALSFFVTIEARAAMMLGKPVLVVMENDKRKPSYAGGKVEVATASWPADLKAYFMSGRFVTWGGEPCEWSIADQDAKLKTILERAEVLGPAVPAGGVSWAGALATLCQSAAPGSVDELGARLVSTHSFERQAEPEPEGLEPMAPVPEPELDNDDASGGTQTSYEFCFSYASEQGRVPPRVLEAKARLEREGHRVFYGKDVSALSSESWRKQWMRASDHAALRVNFLSPAYLRSQACSSEWNHPKEAGRQLNVILGGSGVREEMLSLPLEEMAERGADAIKVCYQYPSL